MERSMEEAFQRIVWRKYYCLNDSLVPCFEDGRCPENVIASSCPAPWFKAKREVMFIDPAIKCTYSSAQRDTVHMSPFELPVTFERRQGRCFWLRIEFVSFCLPPLVIVIVIVIVLPPTPWVPLHHSNSRFITEQSVVDGEKISSGRRCFYSRLSCFSPTCFLGVSCTKGGFSQILARTENRRGLPRKEQRTAARATCRAMEASPETWNGLELWQKVFCLESK